MAEYGSLSVPVYANTKPLQAEVKRAAEASGQTAAATISGHLERGMSKLRPIAGTIGRSVAAGIGLATTAAVAFGVEAYKTAAKVEAMNASLEALGKANHVSNQTIQETIGNLNRYGISTENAQKTVSDLVRAHNDLKNATKLGQIAQNEAVVTGKSYSQIETALTRAVATGNTAALGRAGIYINSKEALQKYANAHGVLVKNLTLAQKQQAALDAVMAAGGRVSDAYAAQLSTPAGALKFMKLQAEELTIAIGERLIKATEPAFHAFANLAGAIFGAVAPGGKLEPILNAIGVVVGKLAAPLAVVTNKFADWITKLDPAKVKTFADMIIKLGPAIAGIAAGGALFTGGEFVKELPFVGGMLKNLLGPLDAFKGLLMDLPLPLKIVGGAFALLMAVSPQFRKEVMLIAQILISALKPVLEEVAKAAIGLVPVIVQLAKVLGPVLATALDTLMPLIQLFADALKAIAPILPVLIDGIVAIYVGTKLWAAAQFLLDTALDANPIGLVVIAIGGLILVLIEVWKHCKTFRDIVLGVFGDVWGWLKRYWPLLIAIVAGPIGVITLLIIKNWNTIKSVTVAVWNWIKSFVTTVLNGLKAVIQLQLGLISRIVGSVLSTVESTFSRVWGTIKSTVSNGASAILRTVQNLGGQLISAGASAINNLLSGMASVLKNVGGWIKAHVVDPIVNAVKSFFGIHSPSTVMEGLGESVTEGFIGGIVKQNPLTIAKKVFGSIPAALGGLVTKGLVDIAKLPGKALSALGNIGGAIGHLLTKIPGLSGLFGGGSSSGTGQWAGLMRSVLAHFGIPQLFGTFMAQMQTESGGNPRAINLWDSNAKAGIPSKGLMQVIDPTFNAYAGPYRSLGIWNPLANIYAAVAYAISRYGSSIGAVLGHGHGYAQGGILNEPVKGIGLRSGHAYSFGENAPAVPEMWSPLRGGSRFGGRQMQAIVINVYPAQHQSETEVAAQVSRSLAWAQATGRA